MGDFFFGIFNRIKKNKFVSAILCFLLFSIFGWIAFQIDFDEDIDKLIPTNSENTTLQRVMKTVNFADKIIVNISLETDGEISDLVDYATDFMDSTSTLHKYIKDIQGFVEDEKALETIDFVYNNLPLFISENDYITLDQKLNRDSIAKITKSNYELLISPTGFIAKNNITKDPFGLSFIGLKQLQNLGASDNFKLKDGFLISKDEKHILLFINPTFDTSQTKLNEEFLEELNEIQTQLNANYQSRAKSTYFGGPLIGMANAKQIKADIQITVSIALTILLLIFILFYKKITIPLILLIPTIFGGLMALAVLSIIRTEISVISLGIGAVLLGITLDYSLHILTHLRNNPDSENLYKTITKPILMSSTTTAVAFLCLLFINSQALQDLGIFAAISVIGSSIFALLFIPQVYNPKHKLEKQKPTVIDQFSAYNFNKNKLIIGGIVLLLIVSIFTFSQVNFNQNLSELTYTTQALRIAEQDLDVLTNSNSKSLYVVAYGENKEDVLQTNDSIFEVLKGLKNEQSIVDFNSVGALVNSKRKQKAKFDSWKAFWTKNKIDITKNELLESGKTFGFKSTTFQEFYNLMENDFRILETEDYSEISAIPLQDFIATKDNFWTITSILKVEAEQIDSIKNQFQNSANIVIIDRQDATQNLLGNLKTEFNDLIIYSFVLILVLLLFFYRNLKLTLITILPIIITWFLTLGIMGLFRLEFNIFNIIISTFIFGLGVDYSIFMTNGLQQEKSHLKTYKTSVVLSVITTILGIGVLLFAKHPALHSLALITVIGIVSAMLISFTIQPILYKLLFRNAIKN